MSTMSRGSKTSPTPSERNMAKMKAKKDVDMSKPLGIKQLTLDLNGADSLKSKVFSRSPTNQKSQIQMFSDILDADENATIQRTTKLTKEKKPTINSTTSSGKFNFNMSKMRSSSKLLEKPQPLNEIDMQD